MAPKSESKNFGSILNKPMSAIERPKPLPIGTYHCVVQGLPIYGESSKKKTPFAEWKLKILSAMEDVDQEDLKEMGGFAGKEIKATYYLTDDAAFMLKDFLMALGLDDEGKTPAQLIDETPGKEILAYIKHEPSNDGTTMFARLGTVAAVTE